MLRFLECPTTAARPYGGDVPMAVRVCRTCSATKLGQRCRGIQCRLVSTIPGALSDQLLRNTQSTIGGLRCRQEHVRPDEASVSSTVKVPANTGDQKTHNHGRRNLQGRCREATNHLAHER